jgi:hypothetical protein
MEVINEVLQDTINDRYIFITYSEDGEVSELNYQQGLSCGINYDYFVGCRKLTEIYKALRKHRHDECHICLTEESIKLFEKLFL